MKTKLPIYNGPEIGYGNYSLAIKKAGPAPSGWRYLKVGEDIPEGPVIFIHYNVWANGKHAIGRRIHNRDLPWAVPVKAEYVGSETDFLRLRILRRDSKKVKFVIDSQRGRGFASFKASNGVEIYSMSYPEVRDGRTLELFVRGGLAISDDNKLTATVSQFNKISVAVHEFNAFKDQPAKVDLSARVKDLEKEVADLKAFKAGVEALLQKKA